MDDKSRKMMWIIVILLGLSACGQLISAVAKIMMMLE